MWKNKKEVSNVQEIKFLKNIRTNLLLRIAVFFTFLGHGIVAVKINPSWFPLMKIYGFTPKLILIWMPVIGFIDIIVAVIILCYPYRIIVIWAIFWAFITAFSRPLAGQDFMEFIERTSNWLVPFILLVRQGIPKKLSHLFLT